MMTEYADLFRLISAIWAVIGIFGTGAAFFWIRKYFPERKEAISPEQLRQEIGMFDRSLREAFNAEFGRLRLSADEHHREILEQIREAKVKAEDASERSREAIHKASMVEERLSALDRLVIEKLHHVQTLLKQGADK